MAEKTRILIVDDERDFAEALGFLLAHQGFSVDWAFDGDEALQRLKQQEFQYVVSDYKMPNVSGQELFEFSENELESPPKFIFVTGFINTISPDFFNQRVLAVFPKTAHYRQIVERIYLDSGLAVGKSA